MSYGQEREYPLSPLQTLLACSCVLEGVAENGNGSSCHAKSFTSLRFSFVFFLLFLLRSLIIFFLVCVSSCSALCCLEILLKWRKIAHFFWGGGHQLVDTRRGRRKSRKSEEKADKKKNVLQINLLTAVSQTKRVPP